MKTIIFSFILATLLVRDVTLVMQAVQVPYRKRLYNISRTLAADIQTISSVPLDIHGNPRAGFGFVAATLRSVTRGGQNNDLSDMFTGTGYKYGNFGDEWLDGVTSCDINVTTAQQALPNGTTYNSQQVRIPLGTAVSYTSAYFLRNNNFEAFYARLMAGNEMFIDYQNVRYKIYLSNYTCTAHTNTYVRTDIAYRTEMRDVSPPTDTDTEDDDSGSDDDESDDSVDDDDDDESTDDDDESDRRLHLKEHLDVEFNEKLNKKLKKMRAKEKIQEQLLKKKAIKKHEKKIRKLEDKVNTGAKIGTI